jgi:hypothetical protein
LYIANYHTKKLVYREGKQTTSQLSPATPRNQGGSKSRKFLGGGGRGKRDIPNVCVPPESTRGRLGREYVVVISGRGRRDANKKVGRINPSFDRGEEKKNTTKVCTT